MNCSILGPSHGLQIFTNFFSVGHFHRVQSFGNRLLPRGSPQGHKPLRANLLQCGVLFSQVHRSYQEPDLVLFLHRVTASFGHPPALAWGGYLQVNICSSVDLNRLQGDSLHHHGILHGLHENLCSGTWSTSSPSFFTALGVCRLVSLTSSHSSLLLQLPRFFFPILKYVITEVLPPSLIGLSLASIWSILEPAALALSDTGEASDSFS